MEQIVQGYKRDDNLFYKLIRKKSFWLVFWIMSFSYPIYRSVNRVLPPPLPVYFQVPEFSLTNEFGKKFGTAELKGKLYIANFSFTNCTLSCSDVLHKMDIVQKRIRGLGTKAQIVTFSVDPEIDTPEVLSKFARARNSNPYVWNYLTGEKSAIKKLLVEGFKVPFGEKSIIQKKLDNTTISITDISHSDKVILVDELGRARGTYATDKAGIDKLMIDLGLLVNNSFNYNKYPNKGNI